MNSAAVENLSKQKESAEIPHFQMGNLPTGTCHGSLTEGTSTVQRWAANAAQPMCLGTSSKQTPIH
jgi:hypothetical protein